jgi:ubiquitin conjugation factor E4 B
MKDPVELPSSRNIVDYMTISKVSNYSLHVEKHLMNEPNDPFNRSPLTLDQLIPRKDIKEKIEAYKASKRQSRQ